MAYNTNRAMLEISAHSGEGLQVDKVDKRGLISNYHFNIVRGILTFFTVKFVPFHLFQCYCFMVGFSLRFDAPYRSTKLSFSINLLCWNSNENQQFLMGYANFFTALYIYIVEIL